MPPLDFTQPLDPIEDIRGAFELEVLARFDNLSVDTQWQRAVDIGNGPGQDNIILAQYENTRDMQFALFQGNDFWSVTAPDAIVEGEEAVWTAGITEDGTMWLAKDGVRLVEGTSAVPIDVTRVNELVGDSAWAEDTALEGAVLGLDVRQPGEVEDGGYLPELETVSGAFRVDLAGRFDDLSGRSDQALWSFGEGTGTEIRLAQVGNSNDLALTLDVNGETFVVTASGALQEGQFAYYSAGVDPDGTLWLEMDGTRIGETTATLPGTIGTDAMVIGRSADGDPLDGAVLDLTVTDLPDNGGGSEPIDPAPPTDPVDTGAPTDPADPMDPTPPATPSEPQEPADPPVMTDAGGQTDPTPTLGGGAGDMFIVAHQDDDLLFMNPTLDRAIDGDLPATTIYLTAGDAGQGEDYWSAREAGEKAAYAEMAGDSDWIDETIPIEIGDKVFDVQTSYLASQPDVRLYFLRLPDGFGAGHGSESYGNESLQKLWEGEIPDMTTVDGAQTYTAAELTELLTALIDTHGPDEIHIQDHWSEHAEIEHSDHTTTAEIAGAAAYDAIKPVTVTSYYGYATWGFEENLTPEEHDLVREVFLDYAAFDPMVFGSDGHLIISYEEWVQREYVADSYTTPGQIDDVSEFDSAAFYQSLMVPPDASDGTAAELEAEDEAVILETA